MGAKEDLIAKLKNKVVEEMNEAQLAGEQHLLFATRLPELYASLEAALDGIPNLAITREKISTDTRGTGFGTSTKSSEVADFKKALEQARGKKPSST